ncbi:MAG TPA: biotin transporter BioY [Acidimicrobiales bacterium]|nr:biotin transporter BioY [Acidimicrobiales bacterium]
MPTQAATLRRSRPLVLADLIPGEWVRDIGTVIGAACFLGLLAQVSIPLWWTPVPITGQTLGVVLAGSVLGVRRAGAALALYAVAGLAGLPWFADHASGWPGGLFGYIVGFFVAAIVCGWFAERRADRRVVSAIPAMLLGNAIIFAIGVPWLAVAYHFSAAEAIAKGLTPFLVGEGIKIALAAALLPAAWRVFGAGSEREAPSL